MTNKVQKIREEVVRLKNELIQEKEKGFGSDTDAACILELQNVLTYIDSLQEEPISVWHDVSEEPKPNMELICVGQYGNPIVLSSNSNSFKERYISKWAYFNDLLNLSNIERTVKDWKEEPVSEELEDVQQTITYMGEVYTRCYKDKLDLFACKYPMSVPKTSKKYAKYSDVDLTIAVKEGAKWQKENLWKPADGDDLPEINREVIALLDNGKVVFAHRPPEYWDGKNIGTCKVTRYYPKTYDKGGWNIPNIVSWLDVELPKEIEL